jgi:hypothetical protein
MDARLIDLIYESSFVPELWPGVLGELAKIATARVGFLFLSNGENHHFAASTELGAKAMAPLVASGAVARSERFSRLVAARHSGFLIDSDVYTDEEKDADPFIATCCIRAASAMPPQQRLRCRPVVALCSTLSENMPADRWSLPRLGG